MKRHVIQNGFVWLLLSLFALASALTVLLGAQAYRTIHARSEDSAQGRILRSFVRSAVQSEDARGAIRVEEFDGVKTLTLTRVIDGVEYDWRIYCHGGELRERFTSSGRKFDPELGETVCVAGSFEPVLSENLLTVTMTDAHGQPCEVRAAVRCAEP